MRLILLLICLSFTLHIQAEDFHKQVSAAETVDGKKIKVAGKVMLVYYWGMKCNPCVKGLPKLEKLTAKFKKKNFVLVTSHVASADKKDISSFMKKSNYSFPVFRYFHLKKSGKNILVKSLPYSFLIDQKGKIIEEGIIHNLEDRISKLLSK